MVNSFTFGTSLAPGVSITQSVLDTVAAPLTNHAIAYLFVTVPGDVWDSTADDYSPLVPLTPTPVASLGDYLELIGGTVPNPAIDYEAYVSYKSVEAFYANSGGSGVLYVIRTVVTPQCKLTLDAATANFNYYSIRIDGVYYGDTDAGFNDGDGIPVKLITTTGLDLADNAFDIYNFLASDSAFTLGYELIDVPGQFTNNPPFIYFARKESGQLAVIENFWSVASLPTDLPTLSGQAGGTVTKIAQKRELNFKLEPDYNSATGLTIWYINPDLFNSDYYTDQTAGEFTYFDGTDGSALTAEQISGLINLYLVDQYPSITSTNFDTAVALGSGAGPFPQPLAPNTAAASNIVAIPANFGPYPSVTDTSGDVRILGGVGEEHLVFFSTATTLDGLTDVRWTAGLDLETISTEQAVKSVQQFSVLVGSPSNRVVITTNGANIDAHEDSLLTKLGDALADSTVVLEETTPNILRASKTNHNITALFFDPTHFIPWIIEGTVTKGIYSWDLVASLTATSTVNVSPYVWPATAASGQVEHKLANYLHPDAEALAGNGFDELSGPRLSDYVYTIRNSVDDVNLFPGFLLCPEGFAKYDTTLSSFTGTVTEARDNRIAIASVLNEVAQRRNWMALIDENPASLTSLDSTNEFNELTNSVGSGDGHFAFYYPYVLNVENVKLPPSPFVAGIALNRYTTESFSQPPAGTLYPLQGVLRPVYKLVRSQLEVNSPRGMNPIVTIPNAGVVVFGARTTATNTPLQFINSRVSVNIVLQSLANSFDGFVFSALSTDNVTIFNAIRTTATTILQNLYIEGALLGATPADAYLVVCDTTNNTPANLAAGLVFCDIILAPASTLERLVIRTTVTSAGQVQSTLNV